MRHSYEAINQITSLIKE